MNFVRADQLIVDMSGQVTKPTGYNFDFIMLSFPLFDLILEDGVNKYEICVFYRSLTVAALV